MGPEERQDAEVRAERALRRGELSSAIGLYESIAAAYPGDPAIAAKLARVREHLQPAELTAAKAPRAEAPLPVALGASSPEQEGERLDALGDYPGAIAAYRRALQERPDNELVQERLAELFRLVRATPQAPSPTDAPLPGDRDGMLRALIDRISSRRRVLR
jgi:tetratricopeptide (TPR) repeat protein